MKVCLSLPRENGFYVILDEETVHSAYEDRTAVLHLAEGVHTLSVKKQWEMGFLSKLFLKLLSLFTVEQNPTAEVADKETVFCLPQDAEVTLVMRYTDDADVKLSYDGEMQACIDRSRNRDDVVQGTE